MNTANETISAEQYRAEIGQVDPPAVAIDPGQPTGVAVAFADGEIRTRTSSFWDEMERVFEFGAPRIATMRDPTYIVEAPYLTKWGVHADNSRTVYNSGGVAREAELLVEGLKRRGYDVVEHDPSAETDATKRMKNDGDFAEKLVGPWEGPNNPDVRDALRLLFIYNVI